MSTSMISNWLGDLERLPDIDISQWQTFKYQHHSRGLDAADLDATLAAVGNVSGWLLEPSAVTELVDQTLVLTQQPLSGDFFAFAGGVLHGWQLRHHGRGQWRLDEHVLEPVAPEEADCLAERVRHRHVDRPGCRLHYWRLWQADADGSPQVAAALLCAIEEDEA